MAHPRPTAFIPSSELRVISCPSHLADKIISYLRIRGKIINQIPTAGFNVRIEYRGILDDKEVLTRFPSIEIN